MQAIIDTAKHYASLYCCGCEGISDLLVRINGNRFKIIRLLAEGNFTFVYLLRAIDETPYRNGDYFALKKITCPFGDIDSVSDALQEINRYKTFHSPYVIPYLDSQIVQQKNGAKVVYILLPYYTQGSLQESINRNLLDGTYVSERECVRVMLDLCMGLSCLHDPSQRPYNDAASYMEVTADMENDSERAGLLSGTPINLSPSQQGHEAHKASYSHNNLKPSNILIGEDNTMIIGDLSACSPSDITFASMTEVSRHKDWVRTHCKTDYAAPELLNPKLNTTINTKVDIWSLGCTMYTLMFGISPFEREEQLNGIPRVAAIEKGMYTFPTQHRYSQEFLDIIGRCIEIDPAARYSTDDLQNDLKIFQARS